MDLGSPTRDVEPSLTMFAFEEVFRTWTYIGMIL